MRPTRPKTVQYRRKRTLKTNYSKRLNLLLSGKPRLIFRPTNTQIITQLAVFTSQGDKIITAAAGKHLQKLGWNYSCKNLPASYLLGLLIGKKAVQKEYKEGILDTGNVTPLHKGRLYAFLKGVLDAGFQVPYSKEKEIFPSEDRISGKHIAAYAKYLKSNAPPAQITENFMQVKQKIKK